MRNFDELIERNQKICGGQPVIRGTRVLLRTLLASLAEGATSDEILADFPTLTSDHVQGVIEFAAHSARDDMPLSAVPNI